MRLCVRVFRIENGEAMVLDGETVRCAPRVPRHDILHLYDSHALRQVDEALLERVAGQTSALCADILKAAEAALGRVICLAVSRLSTATGGRPGLCGGGAVTR